MRALFYIEKNYAFAILRPLQAEIRSRGGSVCWFLVGSDINQDYLVEDEESLPSIAAVQQWNPDAVFVPGNYVSRLVPGLKVEVFHGFDSGKVDRKGNAYHFQIRHCFDLYCTQGESTTQRFLQLEDKYKTFEVVETGWPAVDPLFSNSEANPFSSLDDPRKTILFCSTHSPRYSCAEIIFEELVRLIEKNDYRWLIQFHPMMAVETVARYKSIDNSNVEYIETDNVLPLLQAADIMLCDTSAVLLMFMVQQKPVVTFRNRQPDDHLVNVTEVEKLEDAIAVADSMPENLLVAINAYCDQMHPYRDGCSSGRVLDAVEGMISSSAANQLKRKPINFIREFKERRKFR